MGAVGIIQVRDPGGHAGGEKYLGSDAVFVIFLVALGLSCCARAFSCRSEHGRLFVAVRRLPAAVAPLAAERRLCSSCCARAFSRRSEHSQLFVAVRRLPAAVAPLAAERRLCGPQAQ